MTAAPQLAADGRLRHLLTLDGLPSALIENLLDDAARLREQWHTQRALPQHLAGRTVVNLFFEASTRTRTSFDLAARRLGALVVNFDIASSSTSKGETTEDTLATLEAMDADAFVVRHKENGTPAQLAAHARQAAILNAGDGNRAHPTQGLLDLLTIRDRKGRVDGLNVVICGDIRHSRVARSDVHGLHALGAGSVALCGPASMLPAREEFPGCRISDDFDAALTDADVVIMLRIQRERISDLPDLDVDSYHARYGLSMQRLARARRDALVMHPGPINRGVEIASAVADGAQSAILDQVANGVFVRMAALTRLLAR
ncbi:MAG: aspartate carbamoyltransferase catalytic subunit [Dokdonella sp.]|uniref:aspartate carbamoyltransferase catalytic subunit n=1 Tax=Dokdonella sp. TaxID=2291710 RepID=UPI0025C6C8F0|nr:aspartate carbamoyltransferase catalytic subunit [Dokdonella sp.]MBZ0223756.1 aspartate carbamoyltransferase catalytic subunit [Dokdonella sp.]MCC7254305.1 aspartate carbamoyltransferase catalytic subunit [Dokdonella sp.]